MTYEPKRVDLGAMPFHLDADTEPTRVITVRVPASLHEALRSQAHEARTTLNSLCISRMIATIPQCPILPGQSLFPRQQFSDWQMHQWEQAQLAAQRAAQQALAAANGQPVTSG